MQEDHSALNKKAWNRKAELHFDSEFYDVDSFRAGNSVLPALDIALLGDIRDKSILHLQCHFGMDTLDLQRMGAKTTGIDLSDVAIDRATKLNFELGLKARFICCNIYDIEDHLNEQFDIVYTSYGTIGWLPDIDIWAGIVAKYIKPGGKFVFAEFHPVVWMFDYDFEKVAYNYFNVETIIEEESGTYTNREHPEVFKTCNWNHGMAEVLQALISKGLTLEDVQEYDYSPYDCFKGTIKISERKYIIEKLGNKIPMVYSVVAKKDAVR